MSEYVIDKKLLTENISYIKQKAGVELIGVVKGNGYGLGINELAKILIENGIKTLAVTEVDDAAELRKLAPQQDILVMRSTCVLDEAKIIAQNNCIATIGSAESARVMSAVSQELGVTTKCHLKIDTGMSRYGFLPSQVQEAIACYDLPNLNFTGAYTHFSCAFYNYELTKAQLEIFKDTVKQIEKAGKAVGTIHASNSPALFNITGAELDSVRIGSAFTGRVITRSKTKLNRIGSLEAKVIETKTVPKGCFVGYNGLYKTKKETKIAIVPIGHSDGFGLTSQNVEANLHSVLSQLKKFLKKERLTISINGKKYNVIGEVGLNHTAVDITNSDVKTGDTASVDISPLMVNARIKRIYK